MSHFQTPHAIVGHTHVPLVFREDGTRFEVIHPREGTRLELDQRGCILIRGGVGQPRDGDPRACAMILDTEAMTAEWLRVPYPIERVQTRMRRLGLPSRLAERLALGL
jgi:diadenosine tetraphosphatase ApaH/serine/threonine PP2A family protein phosphatase